MQIFAIGLLIALIVLWSAYAYYAHNSLLFLLRSKKATQKVAKNDIDIKRLFNNAYFDFEAPSLSEDARSNVIMMEAFAHDHNLEEWCRLYDKKTEFDNILFFNLFEYVDNFTRKSTDGDVDTKVITYIFRRHHKQLVNWPEIHPDLQHTYAFMTIKIASNTNTNIEHDPITTFKMSYGEELPTEYQDLLANLENHAD